VGRVLTISIAITVLAAACGGSGGSLSSANWCDTARSVEAASSAFDSPTPETLREFSRQVKAAIGSSPAEIKADVQVLSDFLEVMGKAVDDNNGNMLLAFDSITSEINDPRLNDAGDRINAYNERECGIPNTTTTGNNFTGGGIGDGTTDTVLPPGGIVAGLAQSMGITEDQARCLVTTFDFTSSQPPSDSDLISGFADCGIDPLALGAGG